MTKHEIGILASKLMGMYAWVGALGYFGAFSSFFVTGFNTPQSNTVFVSLLGPALLLAVAGALLFFGSKRVGRLLVSPDASHPSAFTRTAFDVQVVAFSIVGLTLVVFALPTAANYLTGALLSSPFYPAGTPVKVRLSSELPQIVSVVVQLGIGFALFLHPQRLVAWSSRKVTR
jgi:hypothetical protein